MIKTLELVNNKTAINSCVLVWFDNFELRSSYDPDKISQEEALKLIEEYLDRILKLCVKS